jgi:hypothetical protein
MASPSYTEDLLDKIRALPDGKIAEVADFVELLKLKQQQAAASLDERLRAAVEAGLITPPEPGRQRSSVIDTPPISIPGRPLSEIVLEDRR